jgi:hypothetical protein
MYTRTHAHTRAHTHTRARTHTHILWQRLVGTPDPKQCYTARIGVTPCDCSSQRRREGKVGEGKVGEEEWRGEGKKVDLEEGQEGRVGGGLLIRPCLLQRNGEPRCTAQTK